MSYFRKTIIMSVLILTASAIFAAPSMAKKDGPMKNRELEELRVIAELGLSPAQINDLQALRQNFEPRLKEIQKNLDDKTMTKAEARDELLLMRGEFEQKASGILTPAQMEKASKILDRYFASYGMKGGGAQNKNILISENDRYMPPKEKKKPEKEPPAAEDMPRKPGGLGLIFLQRRLGLNEEQLAALAPVMAWLKESSRELLDMRFEGKITKAEFDKNFSELKIELEIKLDGVLSPGQIEKVIEFVEMRFLGLKGAGKSK